jgi:Pilus formation protein N terminal region
MFRLLSIGLILFLLSVVPVIADEPDEGFTVEVDKAKVMRLPRAAAVVIVGNPAIADATVHDGRLLLITGKLFGGTNIIALDARGNTIIERDINVSAPKMAAITYYRGGTQYSYSCAGTCQPSPSIGDEQSRFSDLIKQQEDKADQGAAAAETD